MTPEERTAKSLGGRIGALRRWANTPDRAAALEPARRGFLDRLEQQADPNGELSPAERAAAGERLFKEHMARMALKSAQARARRKRQNAA
jgi:hypothetical protein